MTVAADDISDLFDKQKLRQNALKVYLNVLNILIFMTVTSQYKDFNVIICPVGQSSLDTYIIQWTKLAQTSISLSQLHDFCLERFIVEL